MYNIREDDVVSRGEAVGLTGSVEAQLGERALLKEYGRAGWRKEWLAVVVGRGSCTISPLLLHVYTWGTAMPTCLDTIDRAAMRRQKRL